MTAEPYLLHHLVDGCSAEADRPALKTSGRTLTFGAFAMEVERYARALKAAGLRRGDRVAVLLPKGIEECIAVFAVSRADGVLVLVNPGLKPPQVRHIVNDCRATLLLTNAGLLLPLAPILCELPSVEALVLLDTLPETTIEAKRVVTVGMAAEGQPPLKASEGIGEDLAAILYTSGSTSLPKGVMLSHRNLLAGTRIVRTYLKITRDDRILSILPFSFDYGLNQLLTAVERRACLYPSTFLLGDQIVAALKDNEITGLAGVPSIWAILTRAAPSLARTPLPQLRYITNSGGAVPSATVRRLRELLPATSIYLMYGLTEAFRSTFLPPDEVDRRPTSIGKAIPECEILAVDANDRVVRPGTPGILVHRGPTVSMGYWNRPEDTARVLRRHPARPGGEGGEIVCYSGDLVVQDEEGFFYFVGRQDALIKSSGYRISPTEVEEVLMATGMFAQVAVIGLPDEIAGQRIHAVAVPLADQVDIAAALKACAQALAAYMVPREIELVEALPTTPNGKVDYKALVRERAPDGH